MWRAIERELVDIFLSLDMDVQDEAGEVVVLDGYEDFVLFSVTELAKELMRRGIGQGTPR